jgi:hypothetical protein
MNYMSIIFIEGLGMMILGLSVVYRLSGLINEAFEFGCFYLVRLRDLD